MSPVLFARTFLRIPNTSPACTVSACMYGSSGGGNTIRCLKCQALSRVSASGDLKDLPTSVYLNGLIDVLAIKECKKTQVTCGNYEKKSSEASYCFQCCISYCQECLQPWSQFLEHFTVLLKNELCLLLPLPTPNSMLISNHRDSYQSVNIDFGGRGVSKNK